LSPAAAYVIASHADSQELAHPTASESCVKELALGKLRAIYGRFEKSLLYQCLYQHLLSALEDHSPQVSKDSTAIEVRHASRLRPLRQPDESLVP
jgi:hypothetical protein